MITITEFRLGSIENMMEMIIGKHIYVRAWSTDGSL